MDKYIYDESKWAIIVYGMSCRGIIIFLALFYQLQAYRLMGAATQTLFTGT